MPLNYKAIHKIARDIHHDAQFVTNFEYGDPTTIHKFFKDFANDGVTTNLAVVDTYDTERRQFYKAHIKIVLDTIMNIINKEYSNAV